MGAGTVVADHPGGRWRWRVQVFAGHLQDTILTSGLVMLYAAYRAATERGLRRRISAIGMAAGLIALGGALAGRTVDPLEGAPRPLTPRGGTVVAGDHIRLMAPRAAAHAVWFREAYGTFARDTDWMDGFYPYHEMNAYLGAVAIALAILGGAAYRDRWVAFSGCFWRASAAC